MQELLFLTMKPSKECYKDALPPTKAINTQVKHITTQLCSDCSKFDTGKDNREIPREARCESHRKS